MFRKTQIKIVLVLTVSLILLLTATLSLIYGLSYKEIRSQNMEMLTRYAEVFSLDALPGEVPLLQPPVEEMPVFPEASAYQLSTFYSAAVSETGELLALDTGRTGLYSGEEIETAARRLLDLGKKSGYYESFLYLVSEKNGYTLVSFMDNTLSSSSARTFLRYTLLGSAIAFILITAAAAAASGKIVEPLEENDRRQRQFIANAGHELKTPVSIIETNAELLSRQAGPNEWLSNIQYEASRMGELISQLLDLSHAENSETPKETLDLSHIVLGEVLPFESIAYENGLTIETEIQDGLHVDGNAAQLQQLISILMDNAIRHSDGTHRIHLTLSEDRHYAVLAVSNYGKEISAEEQEKLFDRFYRIDQVRNSREKHYGLGLSIAKAITGSHHGSISVSCKNGFITFTVKLPKK